jgi:PTS_IIC_fructo: PTS system, Fru family, IIC component
LQTQTIRHTSLWQQLWSAVWFLQSQSLFQTHSSRIVGQMKKERMLP